MARFDPYIDIEEGEIIEPPRKPPQQLKVDTTWRKSDKRLSPAREVKLRVEPYPASHTRSRSRGSTPIPKYQAPRNTGQTPKEIKIQLDEFIFKWEQKRDAQTEIPMRADGYARAVARLESLTVYRKVGKGTLEDPEILWISEPDDSPAGRVVGIEKTCRQACYKMGTTGLWIRKYDHGTTRKFTRTAQGQIQKTISEDDPHITVYMGDNLHYLYEGHVYCAYDNARPHIPAGLAKPEDRRFAKDGNTDPTPLLDRRDIRQKAYDMGLLSDPSRTSHTRGLWRRPSTNNQTNANTRNTWRRPNNDSLIEKVWA